MKDKIVFGIRSYKVREKILTKDKLNLSKAINICKTSEQASKQLDEFEEKKKQIVSVVENRSAKKKKKKKKN